MQQMKKFNRMRLIPKVIFECLIVSLIEGTLLIAIIN